MIDRLIGRSVDCVVGALLVDLASFANGSMSGMDDIDDPGHFGSGWILGRRLKLACMRAS